MKRCPKEFISFRSKSAPVKEMTEEQRDALSSRMRSLRKKQLEQVDKSIDEDD